MTSLSKYISRTHAQTEKEQAFEPNNNEPETTQAGINQISRGILRDGLNDITDHLSGLSNDLRQLETEFKKELEEFDAEERRLQEIEHPKS